MLKKLALGTAQFGVNYGIANTGGQVSALEALAILQCARNAKIDLLDTAIAYGESEAVLGQSGISDFKVVSKLPAFPENTESVGDWVCKQIEGSLNRLGIVSLCGLLLHRSTDLLGPHANALIESLQQLKANGLVKKIGVSIYDPAELDRVMQLMNIDLVQAPLSLIDRRLETSGWLRQLRTHGVEVHTRSTFLQGLLLMPRKQIPEKFRQWSQLWDQWAAALGSRNISALKACLAYPLSLPEVDRVVVGVDSAEQLEKLVSAAHTLHPEHDWSFMVSRDPMLINPSNWVRL